MRVVRRFVRRNVRYLIELGVVRNVRECKVSDLVGSCKEFVRSIQRYSIELRAVRSLIEELRGIIELGVVRRFQEKCKVSV